MMPPRREAPGSPSIPSPGTRTPVKVTDGLKVARMPSVSHLPSVVMPDVSAGTHASCSDFPISGPPSPGGVGAGQKALAPETAPPLDGLGAGAVVSARRPGDRFSGPPLAGLEAARRNPAQAAPRDARVPRSHGEETGRMP